MAGTSQQKQPKRLFLTINEHQPKVDLFSKKRQQGACDAVAGTSRLGAKRTKAAKCVNAETEPNLGTSPLQAAGADSMRKEKAISFFSNEGRSVVIKYFYKINFIC